MSRAGAVPADQRRRELAAIHLGKKELGWDDEMYRSVLHQETGKTSAADLSQVERAAVLDRMRELGFRRTRAGASPRRPRPAGSPQLALAGHLWRELADLGVVRDGSDSALQAFGLRMTGVSRLEWCSPRQLVVVIEALKAWLAREGAAAGRSAE